MVFLMFTYIKTFATVDCVVLKNVFSPARSFWTNYLASDVMSQMMFGMNDINKCGRVSFVRCSRRIVGLKTDLKELVLA